jgi:hypothetical protein
LGIFRLHEFTSLYPNFTPASYAGPFSVVVERGALSRPDSKFTAGEPAALDAAGMMAAFEAQANVRLDRNVAISALLAAAPGWREAREMLSGAFAEGPSARGSRDEKDS